MIPTVCQDVSLPRNLALNTGAFHRWGETLTSVSRALLEISHDHSQSEVNNLETAYFTAKTKALNTLKNPISMVDVQKALNHIKTRLTGSLTASYLAKFKLASQYPYSPTQVKRLPRARKEPGQPKQLNNTAPQRRGTPYNQERRGRGPVQQPRNRRPPPTGQRTKQDTPYMDTNVQNFFTAFTAFNYLLKNQNNNANNSYEPYISDFVINLSHCKLEDDHLSALEKGLGFVPTTREPNLSLVASELEAFCRRLRLKEFF